MEEVAVVGVGPSHPSLPPGQQGTSLSRPLSPSSWGQGEEEAAPPPLRHPPPLGDSRPQPHHLTVNQAGEPMKVRMVIWDQRVPRTVKTSARTTQPLKRYINLALKKEQ